jgi:ribosomal protein S18 acetylase RimI-like enzyme
MELVLTEPPALPDGFAARPMTEAEYGPWLRHSTEAYVESVVISGSSDPVGARAKADRDLAELLRGLGTERMSLSVLESDGRPVGVLRLGHHNPDTRMFVYNVEIYAAEQGRGFGRAAMLAGERLALAAGDRTIGLNVFGHNDVARGLYESLGYRVTDWMVGRELRS